MRSASPTLRIADPMTKPPSTSQNASDWKPENRTSPGAARKIVTAAKNSSAVRYSGNRLVAHSRIAMAANQPGWISGAAVAVIEFLLDVLLRQLLLFLFSLVASRPALQRLADLVQHLGILDGRGHGPGLAVGDLFDGATQDLAGARLRQA